MWKNHREPIYLGEAALLIPIDRGFDDDVFHQALFNGWGNQRIVKARLAQQFSVMSIFRGERNCCPYM